MCVSPISFITGASKGWSVDANVAIDSIATLTGGVVADEETGAEGSGSKRTLLLAGVSGDAFPIVMISLSNSLDLS